MGEYIDFERISRENVVLWFYNDLKPLLTRRVKLKINTRSKMRLKRYGIIKSVRRGSEGSSLELTELGRSLMMEAAR